MMGIGMIKEFVIFLIEKNLDNLDEEELYKIISVFEKNRERQEPSDNVKQLINQGR